MRVLVTRPEPGAGKTADLLRRRGHDPVVLPLSRTVALSDNGHDLNTTPASALAVTSAAALRHWRACGIDSARLALPVYAVGEATGEAARDAGFRDVRIGGGTGSDLAETIIGDRVAGRLAPTRDHPLLYIAGRVRHGGFEAAISAVELPLEVVEIYDIEEISYSTDFVLRHFSTEDAVAVLFYSRNTAALFFRLLSDANARKHLKKSVFLCIGDQVAAAVPRQLASQIRVAAAPREDDLLSLLDGVSQSR